MDRSWYYRVGFYAFVTLVACAVLTPTVATWMGKDDQLPAWMKKNMQRKILLGLDLQGGLHLVYSVEVDKAVSDKADRLASEIEEKLHKDKKIKDVRIEREGTSELVVRFTNVAELSKLDRSFLKEFEGRLYEDSRDAPKGEARLKIDDLYIDGLKQNAVDQGVITINGRVNSLGVAEPNVSKKGTDIVVELPGLRPEDFERVKNQIGRTAQLEFKMGDDGSEYMKKLADVAAAKKAEFPGISIASEGWTEEDSGAHHSDVYLRAKDRAEIERFLAALTPEEAIPSDRQLVLEEINGREDDDGGATPAKKSDMAWRTHYLHRRAELTGESIADADVTHDQQTGQPQVALSFDREGTDLFEKASGASIGRKMAIILDDQVKSAPVIKTRIGGGHAIITLGHSFADPQKVRQDALDLVAVLKSGALPAPLKKTFETQVGPTLGRDAVDKAKFSMEIGAIAVIIFMLIYYRMSGLIANVAMVLNILYQLAFMALVSATLTLPGIAGVVLTIGMAVDANIIIYERIREELRAGKSPRGAVEAGFGRAFTTVVDAHVTAFIAAVVLYSYGSGPIKGFAVTLGIGVIANLFTSVWLSRAMFDFMVLRKPRTSLSI